MTALATLTAAYTLRATAPYAGDPAVVGYIGLDVPVELITAAGLRPVRVVAEPNSTGAAPFAEGGGTPLLRGLTAALTEGPYRHLRRLIVSTTPSAYASLFALMRELKRAGEAFTGLEIHLFDFNRAPSPAAAGLRRQAVEGLSTQLADWSGKPVATDAIAAAIGAQNRIRQALAAIQPLRGRGLSGPDALAVFGAADAMSPTDYLAAIQALPAEIKTSSPTGRRTVYSGAETATPGLYHALESRGLVIVADDQDAGSRSVGPLVSETIDPITALADRYFHADPAPARSTIAERAAYLTALAKAAAADHVVFNLAAFDHPPAWDYPAQRAALEAAGLTCELEEADHG